MKCACALMQFGLGTVAQDAILGVDDDERFVVEGDPLVLLH